MHRIIKFNQKAWFKPYIYIWFKPRNQIKGKTTNDFEKYTFLVDEQCSFWKNTRKIRENTEISSL